MRTFTKRVMVAFAFISLLTVVAPAQDPAQNAKESDAQISISIETGRYEPAPDCKKDVDGCFPKIWTPTTTFRLGTRVWLKATVVNRSKLTGFGESRPEIPDVAFDLVESGTGTSPGLTRAGCRLRPDCIPNKDDPTGGVLILSGFVNQWTLPPGTPLVAIEEVTKQFILSDAGEYRISAEFGGIDFAEKDNIGISGPINKDAVTRSRTAKSETIKFVLTK